MTTALSNNPRLLAATGIIGPLVFITGWFLAQLFTPNYSNLHETGSELAEKGSPYAWVMITGFLTFGTLTIIFAYSLHNLIKPGSIIGPIALAAGGLGLIGAGAFRLDPNGGAYTFTGQMHGFASVFVFLGFLIAMFALAFRFAQDPDWGRNYQIISLVAGSVAFVLFLWFSNSFGKPYLGLAQRSFIGTWLLWLIIIASRLYTLVGTAAR